MMIGRNRVMQALKIASSGDIPPLRCASRAKSIIRMPFFLTIPISNTSPISAMMEKSWPQIHSMITAPRPAEGKVEMIVSGCTKLS
ncbi:hypothetical protein D9M69_574490 [compost metagenome]